jgi:cytochrome c-type biogenesis protein CcmF
VVALLFATVFAALANSVYFLKILKGSMKNAGPSVAHVGFALVLLGATISTSKQEPISRNVKGPVLSTLSDEFNDNEEMLLYKGDTVPIGEHFVTYTDSRKDGVNLHFDMDYLKAEPRRFSKGDTVRVRSSIFIANDDHIAGYSFLLDQPEHWRPLDSAAHSVFWHAPVWSSRSPGAKEFTLEPFVQLNPRFGNVAEPSTRHWAEKDLYTHIRYAKLDPEDSTDYMPARLFEKQVGDTIITPTCVIVVDSIRAVRDSVIMTKLGPEYVAYAPVLKVRDLYDVTRWFEAKPVIVYRFDQPVGSKGFEIPALRMKLDIASVKGDTIGINVYEHEFVIMQAIVFPGINILWIGCVLMALGTGMAVWRRVRRTS